MHHRISIQLSVLILCLCGCGTDGSSADESGLVFDDSSCALSDISRSTASQVTPLFETDFSQDSGYLASGGKFWVRDTGDNLTPPNGWDGIKTTHNSTVSVLPGHGVNGSNALKLQWDANASQPRISLAKHLTGNRDTGFDELYIRYHVRFPNNIKLGRDGKKLTYWKWGRLFQNTSPDNTSPGKWTENRADSGFVVWNFGSNVPYTTAKSTWAENTGQKLSKGSAGGERQKVDYFISGSDQHTAPGYFENLWDINTSNRPGELENNISQSWHTLEYRFKLATTSTSNDGIFEMWWDGVNQGKYSRIRPGGGAPRRAGIPTTRKGSGFNIFILFDNMSGWNADWDQPGVDGHIFVNDIVVSEGRIGPCYIIE